MPSSAPEILKITKVGLTQRLPAPSLGPDHPSRDCSGVSEPVVCESSGRRTDCCIPALLRFSAMRTSIRSTLLDCNDVEQTAFPQQAHVDTIAFILNSQVRVRISNREVPDSNARQ
jgi:hypothetical protein